MKKIPSKYRVGGQEMEVRRVERCSDNSVGECCVAAGYIEIANKFNKDAIQSDGSKVNTFFHELTHSILRTMGSKLDDEEGFVCCFSSFLTEAMANAYFVEDESKND